MSTSVAKSPLVGGTGGLPYSFNCPQGSYITNIAGRSANWFDGARFICSDGTTSPWYGGMGGEPWDESSDSGFIGWISARGDNYVDQLTMKKKDGSSGTSRGGDGGDPVAWSGCPSGNLITGARGSAQRYLDGLSFICSPIAAPAPPPSIYNAGTVYTQPPPASSTYSPASPLSTPPVGSQPAPASAEIPYVPKDVPPTNTNLWIIMGFVFFVITAIIIMILMSGDDTPDAPQYAPPQYAAPQYTPQYTPPQYAPPMYEPQYTPPMYEPQYAPQYAPPQYAPAAYEPQYAAPMYAPQ